jgi:hypothetical protein
MGPDEADFPWGTDEEGGLNGWVDHTDTAS